MNRVPYSRIVERRLIDKYQKEFYEKTGKLLRVEDYQPKGLDFPVISLTDLEYILNSLIESDIYSSIRSDTRCHSVVYNRMLFCHMAYAMDYPIKRIADYIERDRSTVYSAIDCIDNLMESREFTVCTLYENTVNKINQLYNGPTISTVSEVSDYTESAVPAALL